MRASAPGQAPVLVVGVYFADRPSCIGGVVRELARTTTRRVTQCWAALGPDAPSDVQVAQATTFGVAHPESKFALLNRLLAGEDLERYAYVLVCDDDMTLPQGFLDDYLRLVIRHDFALAQPARTHNSYIDWHFVEQLDGLSARRTRFVEIGPVFSIRHDLYGEILPFDESAHMGWGCDFVWPLAVERRGLRMGIIDAVPVDHSLRKPVEHYAYEEAARCLSEYLAANPHVSKGDAFTVLESYA